MTRFSPQLRDLSWLVARPIAHRGLHEKASGIVENTESAFAAAIAGNYAIECDVQVTREGEAVVFHDETLERLTHAEGHVRALTVAELKRLQYRSGHDRMQTLGDLLEQVDGRVPLVIEIKSHWDGDAVLALRALKLLKRYAGPCCLMSFDPDIIEAVAVHSPRTVRGIVADRAVDEYYASLPVERRIALRSFSHLARTRPHFVSFHFRELPYAPVQKIRAAGHPVLTWTIRNEEQAQTARRWSDQITFEGFAA